MLIDWINKLASLFNRKSSLIVVSPWTTAFGNLAEDMYYAWLRARREHKKVIFLSCKQIPWKFRLTPIANKELLNVGSSFSGKRHRFFIFLEWCLTIFFTLSQTGYQFWRKYLDWRRPLPVFQPKYVQPTMGRDGLWKNGGLNPPQWKEEYNEYLPVFLDPGKKKSMEIVRKQEMGIPLDDWFVCLHVREAGFRNEPRYNLLRNASILNYIEGIKLITQRGGWVVRLGDKSMTPLPPMERVFDYALSPLKSQFMDLYLISECRFFIGTNSGPQDVARLFQKRELLLNVCEWLYSWPVRPRDRMITKHHFSTSMGRFLSVQETFEASLDCLYYFHVGRGTYELHENTSDEIRDAVQEFLDESSPPSPLQMIARETRNRQLHQWINEGCRIDGKPAFSTLERDRLGSKLFFQGLVSSSFLDKNWLRNSRNP